MHKNKRDFYVKEKLERTKERSINHQPSSASPLKFACFSVKYNCTENISTKYNLTWAVSQLTSISISLCYAIHCNIEFPQQRALSAEYTTNIKRYSFFLHLLIYLVSFMYTYSNFCVFFVCVHIKIDFDNRKRFFLAFCRKFFSLHSYDR